MADRKSQTIATLQFHDQERKGTARAAVRVDMNCIHFDLEFDLRRAVGKGDVQILLMPLRCDPTAMLALQQQFRAAIEPLCVLFISDGSEIESIVQALRFGAISVLSSDWDDEGLSESLRLSSLIYDQRAQWITEYQIAKQRFGRLTPRQTDILELVVSGCTNKATAIKLQMSEKTVEKHRHIIHSHTHTSSLPELMGLYLLAQQSPDVAYCWRTPEEVSASSDRTESHATARQSRPSDPASVTANANGFAGCLTATIQNSL